MSGKTIAVLVFVFHGVNVAGILAVASGWSGHSYICISYMTHPVIFDVRMMVIRAVVSPRVRRVSWGFLCEKVGKVKIVG